MYSHRNGDKMLALEEHLSILSGIVGGDKVAIGVSGGIDSTIVASLACQCLEPDQIHLFTIDTGFLRECDLRDLSALSVYLGHPIEVIDAKKDFFGAIAGLKNGERKRKAFQEVYKGIYLNALARSGANYVLQGTNKLDLRETREGLKTHHNVGIAGLPEITPLADLTKEEIRSLGADLRLPNLFVYRQPFPGPGLMLRCPGIVTKKRIDLLRRATDIFEIRIGKSAFTPSQYLVYLTDGEFTMKAKDGSKQLAPGLVLKAVTTDFTGTIEPYIFSKEFELSMVEALLRQLSGMVSRVMFDMTPSPSTIEPY